MAQPSLLLSVERGFEAFRDRSVPKDWNPAEWPLRRPSHLRAAVLAAFDETCAVCSAHATRIRHLRPHRTVWPGAVVALCDRCASRKRLPEEVIRAAAGAKADLLRRMTGLDLPTQAEVQDAFVNLFIGGELVPPLPDKDLIGQSELFHWRREALLHVLALRSKFPEHDIWRAPYDISAMPPFSPGALEPGCRTFVRNWIESTIRQRNGTWEAFHALGLHALSYSKMPHTGRRTLRIVHAATHLRRKLTTWFVLDEADDERFVLFIPIHTVDAVRATPVPVTRIRATITRCDEWPGYRLSDAVVLHRVPAASPFRMTKAARFRNPTAPFGGIDTRCLSPEEAPAERGHAPNAEASNALSSASPCTE